MSIRLLISSAEKMHYDQSFTDRKGTLQKRTKMECKSTIDNIRKTLNKKLDEADDAVDQCFGQIDHLIDSFIRRR